ncbi:unnamed protein product [Phyllotreta striolata]|uniref:AAA-ATPase-like domain-containing protein n=1 Tax=Phyllotreta striolata TaxID=444603 RepID=A0A9N9TGG7_PHYSR|nr:unnamed protein product [Phyllotreta striolata]
MAGTKHKKSDDSSAHSSRQPSLDVTADNFTTIREDSKIFVDKTMFIKQILEESSYKIILTAPPRFGKSTNMSMLYAFFSRKPNQPDLPDMKQETIEAVGKSLQDKYELFKQLEIYQCKHKKCPADVSGDFKDCEVKKSFYTHCGQYPVVYLDFDSVSGKNSQSFLNGMQSLLKRAFHAHYYMIQFNQQSQKWTWSDKSMFDQGMQLTDFLNYWENDDVYKIWHEADVDGKISYISKGFENLYCLITSYYGADKKPMLLIDQLDAPFIKALYEQSPELHEICRSTREFMRVLLKSNSAKTHLSRAIITCTTTIGCIASVEPINIDIRSFTDQQYIKHFGFNKLEVQKLVEKNLKSKDQQSVLKHMKTCYDNYSADSAYDIYCPLSVKQYILHKTLDNYWYTPAQVLLLYQPFQHEQIRKIILVHLESYQTTSIDITLQELTVDNTTNLKNLFHAQETELQLNQIHLFLRFLTECGYFTVTKRLLNSKQREIAWTICIPNSETEAQISKQMNWAILNRAKSKLLPQKIESLRSALKKLQANSRETYLELVHSLEDLYSDGYQPVNQYNFLKDISMMLSDENESFHVHSDYPELIVVHNTTGIVLELKRGRSESADSALRQILSRKYWKTWERINRKIVDKILIGLHLDGPDVTMRYLENPDYRKKDEHLFNRSVLVSLCRDKTKKGNIN